MGPSSTTTTTLVSQAKIEVIAVSVYDEFLEYDDPLCRTAALFVELRSVRGPVRFGRNRPAPWRIDPSGSVTCSSPTGLLTPSAALANNFYDDLFPVITNVPGDLRACGLSEEVGDGEATRCVLFLPQDKISGPGGRLRHSGQGCAINVGYDCLDAAGLYCYPEPWQSPVADCPHE